ncbi:alpha/beta hydrolase fold domain-containing protein [Streptomyces sp. NPDC015171]|uniref:alpha/beta hydrolase fold domain-containing protein n=1 Tax=Streptomyces sp. NPDC015171 TaxID=3364945 RepID=UPI0036FA1C36
MNLPLPVVRELLRPFFRMTFHPRVPWPAQRLLVNALSACQPLPRGTRVEALWLGARRAERVTAGPASGPGAVLYLHGGGFTVGSPATHRALAAHLARATGRPVYLLDYRLAPEHPCPAALEDTLAAVELLARLAGHPTSSLVLAGDSAGGGIALAAAQHLAAPAREPGDGAAGRPGTPAALVLVSPWADPGEVAEQRRDLVVSRAWGLACAAAYRGQADPADPRYAPARGDLTGLPPTYLHTNMGELLHAQCVALASSLRGAGVPVTFRESRKLWHAAQAQAGLVEEAAESVRDIGSFLTERWARLAESGAADAKAG